MDTLRSYVKFFNLQQRDLEQTYKEYADTSLSVLFDSSRAFHGRIVGVTPNGHVVLNFDGERTPRLKVPMEFCGVRAAAFKAYGDDMSAWSTTSIKFREIAEFHTAFSKSLPLFYLNDRKTIGCGQVDLKFVQSISEALARRKDLKFIMLETIPPTELLVNLADYIELHPEDANLLLKPSIKYDGWNPQELKNTDPIANIVIESLEKERICVLQGPPGTGKSYTIAKIVNAMCGEGASICVATQSNKSLLELVEKKPLMQLLNNRKISKTLLTADEAGSFPTLKLALKNLFVAQGELLCTTYYMLSRIINEKGHPIYDVIIIEEASQAYLTTIAAFLHLGKKCLIIGDPMQLPSIVEMKNDVDYKGIDVEVQVNGMMTFICSKQVPCYRITTSYRLTPLSASQTSVFYDGNLSSVQEKPLVFEATGVDQFFPKQGGCLICNIKGASGAICSQGALEVMRSVENVFMEKYSSRKLAILSPFVKTTKELQREFCDDKQRLDITVETINRIQGLTVDYVIFYVPNRYTNFAFNDNLFNVATSRSESTTLILTDIPIDYLPIASTRVKKFISLCPQIDYSIQQSILKIPEKLFDPNSIDYVKALYPGLEDIVEQLMENNIAFSHEGDVELIGNDGVVLASAEMILRKYGIVINPVDDDSCRVFEAAGYSVVSATEFNINMIG